MHINEHADTSQDFVLTTDNVNEWRVLIIDDVEDNITVLSTILEIHGVAVETADNCADGIEKMQIFRPNLLLLDLAMPEMDGWDMKQFVDSTPDFSHIPVIAVTAHQSREVKSHLEQTGFAGMIAKPFNVRTIIDDICDMLDA